MQSLSNAQQAQPRPSSAAAGRPARAAMGGLPAAAPSRCASLRLPTRRRGAALGRSGVGARAAAEKMSAEEATAARLTAEQSKTVPAYIDPSTATNWHYVVANAEFMLSDENNEHFPEVLRERRRFFNEQGVPVNFFIVPEPAWLDSAPEGKRVRRPAVAVVCPDKVWITYIKLRMDRVLRGEMNCSFDEITKSNGAVPSFPNPTNWAAPYNKYANGWWDLFTVKK